MRFGEEKNRDSSVDETMDYLLQIFQFLENGSCKLVGSGTKWRSEHLVEKVCYFLGWKFECTAISLLEDKQ